MPKEPKTRVKCRPVVLFTGPEADALTTCNLPDGVRIGCLDQFMCTDQIAELMRVCADPQLYGGPRYIKIIGKMVEIPRLQAAFGEGEYKFSGLTEMARPLDSIPGLVELKQRVEQMTGEQYSYVLVNYYADGSRYIGWHSDDERDLDPTCAIASLSIGAERRFLLRHKQSKQTYEIPLPSGRLVVMGGTCQAVMKHSVPRQLRVRGPRVNFTFRRLAAR